MAPRSLPGDRCKETELVSEQALPFIVGGHDYLGEPVPESGPTLLQRRGTPERRFREAWILPNEHVGPTQLSYSFNRSLA